MWPFDFQFYHTVETYNKEGQLTTDISEGFEEYGHFPHSSNREYLGEDPLLVINVTKTMASLNATYAVLRWDIGPLYNYCDDAPFEEDVEAAERFQNQLYFSFSSNGSMPEFSASPPCPQLAGALSIDGEMLPTG